MAASRTIQRHEAEIAALLAAAACDRGDFPSYAGLRQRVREVEADAARARRTDRRAAAVTVLLGLQPGDIIHVPPGRHQRCAAVLDPGLPGRSGPEPTVKNDPSARGARALWQVQVAQRAGSPGLPEVASRGKPVPRTAPETARIVADAADHARALLTALTALAARPARASLLASLGPTLGPLLELMREQYRDEPGEEP